MPIAPPQYEMIPQSESRSEIAIVVSRALEQRRAILRFVVIILLLTIVTVVLIPSEYESTVRLMPPEKQQLGGLAAMLAAAGEDKGGAIGSLVADSVGLKSSGALYVGILKSATVENALVNQFNLRKVYRKRYLDDARKRLSEQTEVAEDRKSGLISLTVTDHSAGRAQEMASSYISTLNSLMAQLNTSSAHRERLFLEDRLQSARQDLESADKQLSEFSSKNLTLDVKEQGKAMVEGAAALEGELIAAESQLGGLEQIYTSSNVRVKSLQGRIDLLKQKLAQFRGGTSAASKQSPAGDGNDIGISIAQLPVLGMTYYDLLRQAKIQETVFEILTKQYELSKIEEAKELPSIKMLDPPELPEKSSGPPRIRIILLAIVVALCVALLWVWADYRWVKLSKTDSRKAAILDVKDTLATALRPSYVRTRSWMRRYGKPSASAGESSFDQL